MKFAPVLSIVCICLLSCMSCENKDKSSTAQRDKKQDHWIWKIAKIPSQSSDGFVHLVSAIEKIRNGQELESVNETILEAANCNLFKGKPNRFYEFGEKYSDRLVAGDSEILYADLIPLGEYLVANGDRLIAEEQFEDALELAESMLALGWLIVTNGEDNVLALWRLAMWSGALKIMNKLAVLEGDTAKLQKLKDAEASMQIEFEEIRQRPSGPLYFPAKK